MRSKQNRGGQRGVILILACFCMPVMIGLLGLGVDLSVMYSVKAKLQMACDGAAVAAIRSLSLALDTQSQASTATAVAAQWFTANFAGNYMGSYAETAPTIALNQDPATNSRTITVTASTKVPTYFMRYFGKQFTLLSATGATTRKDVVMMLVLDRSGSMNNANNTYGGLTPCQVMVNSAKQFVGMFTENRDRIGLVTFAETGMVVSSPALNFQSTLGYTNSGGTGTGALDTVTCNGWTNTSTGLALAFNELYKTSLPGAQNVIILFTDGQPTAATFNFVTPASQDPTGTAQTSLLPTSQCEDSRGTALTNGGDMVNFPSNWLASQATSGSSIDLGPNSWPGWSPLSGPIGALANSLSSVDGFYSPGSSPNEFSLSLSDAPKCSFTGDIAYIPPTDVWGNSTSGYLTGLSTTSANGAVRTALTAANFANVVFNLGDNQANFARTAHTLPSGASFPGIQINAIGLGGNGGVDYTFLQRVANDPNGNNTVPYPANAAFNPAQPVGTFIYSPNASDVSTAFTKLGSIVMRMAK